MNHTHLILNHLPITLIVFGLIMMACGFLFKSEITRRMAFALYFLAALFGFASFYTGEEAKKLTSGIDEHFVAFHQQAAFAFLMLLYIAGMFSLIGFWASWQQKTYAKIITLATIGCLIVALYFGIKAGMTGGEIRHPEIR